MSELTGQPIPIIMRTSLLIKTKVRAFLEELAAYLEGHLAELDAVSKTSLEAFRILGLDYSKKMLSFLE